MLDFTHHVYLELLWGFFDDLSVQGIEEGVGGGDEGAVGQRVISLLNRVQVVKGVVKIADIPGCKINEDVPASADFGEEFGDMVVSPFLVDEVHEVAHEICPADGAVDVGDDNSASESVRVEEDAGEEAQRLVEVVVGAVLQRIRAFR